MSFRAGRLQSSADIAESLILQRIAESDRSAFERLFDIYHSRLFKFLFRLTRSHGAAEELTNDVLLTVWNDARKFRGDSKVSTWIFGIAYRQALAYLRKQRMKLVAYDENQVLADTVGQQFDEAEWVQQGVCALPPKQRITVMLVYFLGLSCEEAAIATGVPASTVKTRMFHARKKLKTHLAITKTPRAWTEGRENDRD